MPLEQEMDSNSDDNDNLQARVDDLQRQLNEQQTYSQALWQLLVLIGSRLQMSSTSIKMAVSSLLDYEIFWDPSTAHEFLQVIDTSSDRTSDLAVLLTLAFRSQAKSLEIDSEPYSIQEILETLVSELNSRYSEVKLTVDYPPEGKPVFVDYQYFVLAFSMLFEVLLSEKKNLKQLSLQAVESPSTWQLRIDGLDATATNVIKQFFRLPKGFMEYTNKLLPENTLKLIVASRILLLQKIRLVDALVDENQVLELAIPVFDK